MRIIITDLLTSNCDVSGKTGVECVTVQLDDNTPAVNITPAELLKVVRLKKKQERVIPNKS
ncbi:MAG: hypothetical protein ABSE63_10090 [Thermoguttaceae bacterium]|jgi:hypothetical protein